MSKLEEFYFFDEAKEEFGLSSSAIYTKIKKNRLTPCVFVVEPTAFLVADFKTEPKPTIIGTVDITSSLLAFDQAVCRNLFSDSEPFLHFKKFSRFLPLPTNNGKCIVYEKQPLLFHVGLFTIPLNDWAKAFNVNTNQMMREEILQEDNIQFLVYPYSEYENGYLSRRENLAFLADELSGRTHEIPLSDKNKKNPKEQTKKKRTNELHELICKEDRDLREELGKIPTTKELWYRLEEIQNQDNCIQEITHDCIYWRSRYGNERVHKFSSLSATLSNLRKKSAH